MLENKDVLRAEALRHRVMMDPREEDPDGACDIFFEAVKPEPEQAVATYWPKEKEFDPYAILERLLANGNVCGLPVVQKDSRILKFARWAEGDAMEDGPYDIPQPVVNDETQWLEPDIVIVPLLAFDRYGTRLGYGGGYYDATLRALRGGKAITAVGVGFAQQVCLFKLPKEDHDEKLDFVITPQQAHDFREE